MPLLNEVEPLDLNQDQQLFTKEREEATAAERKEVAEEYETQRRRAIGTVLQVDSDIVERIDDPVEATRAGTAYFKHIADSLEQQGQMIVDNASAQSTATTGQTLELESTREELSTAQHDLERLQRQASRAGDLEIQLTEADRLATAQQERIDGLQHDKSELQSKLSEERAAHEATRNELRELRQQVNDGATKAQAMLDDDKGDEPEPPAQPTDTTSGDKPVTEQPAPDTSETEHEDQQDSHNGILNGNGGLATDQQHDDRSLGEKLRDRIPRPKRTSRRGPTDN
jgi:monoamine oxidase